jgi:hypothetical protein
MGLHLQLYASVVVKLLDSILRLAFNLKVEGGVANEQKEKEKASR